MLRLLLLWETNEMRMLTLTVYSIVSQCKHGTEWNLSDVQTCQLLLGLLT